MDSPVTGMTEELILISRRPENMIFFRASHDPLLRPDSNPMKAMAVSLLINWQIKTRNLSNNTILKNVALEWY